MKRCTTAVCVFALAVLIASFAQPALAIETAVNYNTATEQLEFSIVDGQAVTYDVKFIADSAGCALTDSAHFSLDGPNGSDVMQVVCTGTGGSGYVQVQICEGAVCFAFYDFYFRCHSDCQLSLVSGAPSLTTWGLIGLAGLFILSAAFVLYRRRVTA
jgi:hypothetical protein